MIKKYAIAIHGGAGGDSAFIRDNESGYRESLREVIQKTSRLLIDGGTALDAVESAIIMLEDDPLFNAGRGSALNRKGKIAMDASIMCGETIQCGSVALVEGVKNPISLARKLMGEKDCILIAGEGAMEMARASQLLFMDQSYFITEHQLEEFQKEVSKKQKQSGTVGAVVLDLHGNLAAGVSTGGLAYRREGRIGDSAMIGSGCFARNSACAVAGTGDGESLIKRSISHHLSLLMENGNLSMQQACNHLIHQIHADAEGDMGIVAIGHKGDVGMAFNSRRMHRASLTSDGIWNVCIYNDEINHGA